MFARSSHPTDEEILRFIDHELPAEHAERLREHLDGCCECHARQASIKNRSETLDDFYGEERIETNARPVSRIRLQEKLVTHRRGRSFWHGAIAFRPALSTATVTMLVAIGLAFYVIKNASKPRPVVVWSFSNLFLVPNGALTPGAVRPVSLQEICSATDDDLDPKVSLATEVAVMKEYGISSDATTERKYQIDYLVNPQLGGTDDIRNLWPQPYSNGRWNAHAKDVLERHLHQMVCNHTVDLAEAQKEIAGDWIAAYRKYIGRQG